MYLAKEKRFCKQVEPTEAKYLLPEVTFCMSRHDDNSETQRRASLCQQVAPRSLSFQFGITQDEVRKHLVDDGASPGKVRDIYDEPTIGIDHCSKDPSVLGRCRDEYDRRAISALVPRIGVITLVPYRHDITKAFPWPKGSGGPPVQVDFWNRSSNCTGAGPTDSVHGSVGHTPNDWHP